MQVSDSNLVWTTALLAAAFVVGIVLFFRPVAEVHVSTDETVQEMRRELVQLRCAREADYLAKQDQGDSDTKSWVWEEALQDCAGRYGFVADCFNGGASCTFKPASL